MSPTKPTVAHLWVVRITLPGGETTDMTVLDHDGVFFPQGPSLLFIDERCTPVGLSTYVVPAGATISPVAYLGSPDIEGEEADPLALYRSVKARFSQFSTRDVPRSPRRVVNEDLVEIGTGSSVVLRDLCEADAAAVARLLNGRRLTGQPVLTGDSLLGALDDDATRLSQFSTITTVVALDEGGRVSGAVSYGEAPDRGCDILWVAYASASACESLIDHVLGRSAGPVRAFRVSSALSRLHAGLARSLNAELHEILVRRGFTSEDLCSYYARNLENAKRAPGFDLARLRDPIMDRSGYVVGFCEYSIWADGVGVVWALDVSEPARGKGYATNALSYALSVMSMAGAHQAIFCVESTLGDSERAAMAAMASTLGFTDVEHLWTYSRP